jgi:hypothetical protein
MFGEVGLLHDGSVAGDHEVEVVSQGLLHRPVPVLDAAIGVGIAERRAVGEEVAHMDGALALEEDDGVAVGVAAAEVTGHDLLASQHDLRLVGERDARDAGHLAFHHVGAGVAVQDDFGVGGEHGLIAAGVVPVVMRVEDEADRLVADALHLGQNLRVVLRELVVDQEHALVRGQHGDVAAAADDDVEAVGDLFERELGGLLVLRPGKPKARGGQNDRNRTEHSRSIARPDRVTCRLCGRGRRRPRAPRGPSRSARPE